MNTFRAYRWFAFGLIALLLLAVMPGLGRAQETEGPLLYLKAAQFDPLEGELDVAQALQSQSGAGVQSYLLQFSGPVLEEWKQAVEAAGARLYGYVPDYAFIARMDPETAGRVGGLGYVRWVGLYHPAYRLAPELLAAEGEASAAAAGEPPVLTIETFPDADLPALESRLQDLGGRILASSSNELAGYVRLELPAGRLAEAAGLDGVVWIERYYQPEIFNNVGGTGIMRAGEARSTLGLSGQGQVVTVADTGLDRGAAATHPDVQGRVVKAYCLGRPSPCDWSDFNGHGTHVVGSALGSGASSGGLYAGTAPQAGLIIQSLDDAFGTLGGIPADVGELMRKAVADGSFIHSNSWGGVTGLPTNPYGGYTQDASQVDAVTWQNKGLLVLFAAGNGGVDVNKDGLVDPDSLASPGTSKNALTVGASENYRPTFPNTWGTSYGQPIAGDLRANNTAGMAAFSSRGPTDDGRLKPDVVAPGTFIASMRTQNFLFNDSLETADTPTRYTSLGGSGNWSWTSGDAHSPTHAWKAGPGSDILLAPAVNLMPVGSAFQLSFFHKYTLGDDDRLKLWFTDGDLSPALSLPLDLFGTQSAFGFESLSILTQELTSSGVDVSQLRIGFSIDPGIDGVIDGSQWWLDDLRLDGASWGTLGSYGLVTPGSALDDLYVMQGGTSMSTPLTAGAAALVREWLVTRYTSPLYPNHLSSPSGALLKAVLINGAVDLAPGQYESPQEVPATRPNNVTGWGRVDLMSSMAPDLPDQVWLVDNKTGLATGESATYNLTVSAPAPGSLAAPVPEGEPDTAGEELAPISPPGTPIPGKSAPAPRAAGGGEALSFALIEEPQAALGGSEASAAAAGVVQLIKNPGFETSDAWVATGMARTTAQAFAGSWSMGSTAGQDGEFYQPVSIPADTITATLQYAWKNENPDLIATNDCYDGHSVEVWNADFTERWAYISSPELFCLDDSRWQGIIIDFPETITAKMRGQTINVLFYVEQNDKSSHATFYIDDVVLKASVKEYPLRVTLAWTDYPGAANASRALVNNLDLEVIAPGGVHYWGNAAAYPPASPCLSGGRDICNNVEGVIIPEAAYGDYRIVVHGVNVPQGGKQPFAVVANGSCILGSCALNERLYLPLMAR